MSEWDWELTDTARRNFEALDAHARDRITSKLDAIVTDEWRDPLDYLEPLEAAPHSKLRIGPFRLGVGLTAGLEFSMCSEYANVAVMTDCVPFRFRTGTDS